jgi:hypothetical protein
LIQYLATQEYTYIVLNEDDHVLFNQKLPFDTTTKENLRQVAHKVAILASAKLTLDFQKAIQWYTENFNIRSVHF